MDIPTLCSSDLIMAANIIADGMFDIGFGIAIAGFLNAVLRK